jgi:undecaprenyl-diphosphatase
MKGMRTAELFCRMDALEYAWCLRLNRTCGRPAVRAVFKVVSRLGDGVFWYTLMALLPVIYGEAGLYAALRMALVGALGSAIYKYLKSRLIRERPYVALLGVVAGTHALDRYSFPSGHTLHAASFTTLSIAQFPELGWLCAPFAVLIAISRVVLGLHYPTDVIAGAAVGCSLAGAALFLAQLPL